MNLSLYRKYRPQVFSDVIGQDHVVKTLERAISSSRLGHAYLFCGARGVGKTSVARILAKAVNCVGDRSAGTPCGKCKNCLDIAKGQFIDLIEIDAASNRGIDEMRELRDKIAFAPNVGKMKVYIIDEVHMLTREAFNALLKTLEEPPAHSIFIFATTEVHKLPETIISRCQRFDFRLGGTGMVEKSVADIAKGEKLKIPPDIIKLISRASGGSYRDAQSLLDQIAPHFAKGELTLEQALKILNLSGLEEILEFIEILQTGEAAAAIQYLTLMQDRGVNFEQFLDGAINQLRTELVEKIKAGLPETLRVPMRAGEEAGWHGATLKRLVEAAGQMKISPVESLPLELAAVDICGEAANIENHESRIMNHELKTNVKDENKKIIKKQEGPNLSEKKPSTPITKPPTNLSSEQKIAFVESVNAKNKPLGSLLSTSQLEYENGILKIFVEYPLYKVKITHKKCLALLEGELSAILGSQAKIECEVKNEENIGGEIEEVFGE